ncbi:MAG: hypothetical protein EA399_14975 [Desulfovibrionales bacterium]|nr:MAG: hypothetical protein EA399_14975 [Desulfovibrionales bacterium]
MSVRLVVSEYERFRIGKCWSADQISISHDAANVLSYSQERSGRELIRLGWKGAQATNWVGSLGIGRDCLDILPKIDDPSGGKSRARARQNLLWMVARAGLIPTAPAELVRLGGQDAPLIKVFMDLYVGKLASEWRKGSVRDYLVEEANRSFLRGKLLLPEHLRANLLHRERFFTACDEFSSDTPLSRVLKGALRICAAQVFSPDLANKARKLLHDFDSVADAEYCPAELDSMTFDRRFNRFAPLFELAKKILMSRSPESGSQREQFYSLLFDMNEVFEKFVAAEIQTALAGSEYIVNSNAEKRYLLLEGNKKCFGMCPDIQIKKRKETQFLVDTKWKRLDPGKSHFGVSQQDIYQMYAYGKEYNPKKTILLYPHNSALKQDKSMIARLFHNNDRGQIIEVHAIDITKDMREMSVTIEMRQSLEGMLRNVIQM